LIRSSVAIVVVVAGTVVVAAAVELVGGTVTATVVETTSVVTTEAKGELVGAVLPPPLQDAPNRAERTPIAINRFIVGTHRNHCERAAQIAVRCSTLSAAWSSPSEMRGHDQEAEPLHHPAYQ
jgi:hypothetical protein